MSAPQHVTLTRACCQCIKAKRRCSRILPRCQRCTKQGLSCQYKNAPHTTTTTSSVPDTTVVVSNGLLSDLDSDCIRDRNLSSYTLYTPESSESVVSGSTSFLDLDTSSLSGMRLGPPDVILTLDEPTMNYLMQHLRSFTNMFACTSGTPFIHPALYENGFPPQLQDVFRLCCTHGHFNQSNSSIVSQAIANTASALISSVSSAHTFISLLELLQSLILLQIITLLYPTDNQTLHKQAENRMQFLRSLTRKLFRSVPAFLPASLTPYQAWILAESVRRTIHIEHMLQGVYSVMTRGHFVLSAFVEALPLNQKSLLWDYSLMHKSEQSSSGVEVADTGLLETDLISYRELTDMWDRGEITRPRLFEEMLIVACKGTVVLQP